MFPGLYGILSGGGAFDPEAAALFAAMTTPPSAARKTLINAWFVGIKTDFGVASIADIFDIFYMMAAHDSQAARLNWVNPATFTLSPQSSPTFTADRGYAGNGSSSYLNTSWNPATNGVRYTINSASLGIYSQTAVTSDRTDIGIMAAGATGRTWVDMVTTTSLGHSLHQGSSRISSIISYLGMNCANREAANSLTGYKNGVSIGNYADVANSLPSLPFFILARNNNGVADKFSGRQLSIAFAGRSMTAGEHLALFNRIEAYLDAIGAGVV